jgi:translation initiation factor IF-2
MKKIYELAKELGIKSKDIIDVLRKNNINVKSHMSSLDEKTIEFVMEQLTSFEKVEEAPVKVFSIITLSELATRIKVDPNEVIKKLIETGQSVSLNQNLTEEQIELIGKLFNKKIEVSSIFDDDALYQFQYESKIEDLSPRAPIVTIMGHVDHGKTTLLDTIRKTNIASKEAGNITQHIGAYTVSLNKANITFLDTPGHEAFTLLRARGAKVTDIVVLIVAADDGVMPQTIEAINHAKAANVPIIVAINKIDKNNANIERTKKQLSELDLIPEEWGGKTIFVEISAKKGIGIDELLEMIVLQAELLELKANKTIPAKGTIIEAKLDRLKGPVATVLVQDGVLKISDSFICGMTYGKVRAMINDRGERVKIAFPSQPVEILGFSDVPIPGNRFIVLNDERKIKEIIEKRNELMKAKSTQTKHVSLKDLYEDMKKKKIKKLNIILKTDVAGSLEVLSNLLVQFSNPEIEIAIIHAATGDINESDVVLASASDAIIIGFNVKCTEKSKTLASSENVEIKLYKVIYEVIEDMKSAIEGLVVKKEEQKEVIIGKCEIKQLFSTPQGVALGVLVTEGKITRSANARVIRNNTTIYTGKIISLRRFKEDVKEVLAGYECGVMIDGLKDVKEHDLLEIFM